MCITDIEFGAHKAYCHEFEAVLERFLARNCRQKDATSTGSMDMATCSQQFFEAVRTLSESRDEKSAAEAAKLLEVIEKTGSFEKWAEAMREAVQSQIDMNDVD